MMDIKYLDFIGMYSEVYPDGFCNHVINEFEKLITAGHCGNRQDNEGVPKTKKEDIYSFLNLKNHLLKPFNGVPVVDIFFEGLQKCYESYTDQFDILKGISLKCTAIKIQKTVPGAGYHVWHCEQGSDLGADRCLVYSLYLNDIDGAGETEFLYQKLRIEPKENCMIIWPAAYTHTHRGNVVHGNKSKYIITGWFYLD
jgi:hypothetical protein